MRSRQSGVTLVELLVGMAIMGVISTMLLTGWFALSQSWGFTTHSADVRDSARQAMQRMQREIRDAEKPPPAYQAYLGADSSDAIIYRARPYWIAFCTTFNELHNDTPAWSGPTPTASPSTPHLVVYRLYSNGELWRFEDRPPYDGDVGIDMGDPDTPSSEQPSDALGEQTTGEGATLMLSNVVNFPPASPATPIFMYNKYDYADADLQSDSADYGSARQDIIAVQLRILVDLDPARAPVYADLRGTSQLRNAR